MSPQTREALDKIDEILYGLDLMTFEQVWDVLTALRGPDHPGDSYCWKSRTTAKIRGSAFPKTADRLGLYVDVGSTLEPEDKAAFEELYSAKVWPHWFNHITNAFRVFFPNVPLKAPHDW